ncbi:dUTP diphosphatase [Sorangium sp. So ce118]
MSEEIVVRMRKVTRWNVEPPRYQTDGAAGFDLRAAVDVRVPDGGQDLIPCGYAFEIPAGYEGQVRGRSSMTRAGIYCPTGTIDSDFRGEVSVYIDNRSGGPIHISVGDRIAQMVIAPAPQARLVLADDLSDTVRGTGGFGSTGVR